MTASVATTVLTVEALDYGHAGKTVGRELAFSLGAGEVLAVLGPNGSGKTTLLRTLLGLIPRQAGRICIGADDLEQLDAGTLALRAGYVPQVQVASFAYSVRDVVMMGRSPHLGPFSMPGRRDEAAVDRALHRLGLGALADALFSETSGGEQQLTLIARALAQEVPILLMDEPTASLDLGNQVRVLRTLVELAEDGVAVLFTTHDPGHALLAAQRAMLLRQGRCIALGPTREVVDAPNLESLYGVAVRMIDDGEGNKAFVPSLAIGK